MEFPEIDYNNPRLNPTLTVKVQLGDGEPREFTQRKKTAGVLAFARRVETLYRRSEGLEGKLLVDAEGAPVLDDDGNTQPLPTRMLELVYWIMGDRRLLNDALREFYDGPHDGVDWYNDADGEDVGVMLLHFFTTRFGTAKKRSAESSISSPATDTSSTANADEDDDSSEVETSSPTSPPPGP